jgi:hypothetical protein
MLCVKRAEDIPRAITTLVENNATDRAFLEISLSDFLTLSNKGFPAWDKVYYLIEVSTIADVSLFLNRTTAIQRSRAFTLELNGYAKGKWSPSDITTVVHRLHAVNVRSLAATEE